jgi:hypothetical protein
MTGVRPHTGRRGRTERRVGAFFDVDKTILSENSGTLYLKALYDRGEAKSIGRPCSRIWAPTSSTS